MILKTSTEILAKGFSKTMIETYLICKRRFYNDYVLDFRKYQEKGIHEQWGSAWDGFFNIYYGSNLPESIDNYIDKFSQDFPSTLDYETKYYSKTQSHGINLLKKYIEIYPKESEPFKVIETQKEIQVEYQGTKLHGIIDALIEYRGGFWIMENKTTSVLGASYFNGFENDYQTYIYLKIAELHYQRNVEGILYNIIGCKKKIDRDNFLRNDLVGCKTKAQIDYHLDQFLAITREIQENLSSNDEYPMSCSKNACFAYMKKCPYLDSCMYNGNINLIAQGAEENGNS